MKAAYLPGNSTVVVAEVPDPEPGPGQVLVSMRASSICGSDIRAIYREHLGTGPEAYQDVVAGHEPAGMVQAIGEGVVSVSPGDRVVVYHISGCGTCAECRKGYQISCTSPLRAAYGWQRDGGHADLLVAEERDLLTLPDNLTYLDGACVACGFGTAYEALCRLDLNGTNTLAIVGMGPVGLATAMLAQKLGVREIIGIDLSARRLTLARELSCVDRALTSEEAADLAHTVDAAVDCSGAGSGQLLAVNLVRRWGRVAFVGEGGTLTLDVSAAVIHRQLTLIGSWVTSTVRMQELLQNLSAWNLHPGRIVTGTYDIDEAAQAYLAAAEAQGGKIAITWPDPE